MCLVKCDDIPRRGSSEAKRSGRMESETEKENRKGHSNKGAAESAKIGMSLPRSVCSAFFLCVTVHVSMMCERGGIKK